MNDLVLAKSKIAEAFIEKHSFVKFGSSEDYVVPATAATDKIIGATDFIDVEAGERVDVHLIGPVHVRYGAVVTRGDLLTSDGNARAISTTTANNRIGGIAMQDGVLGDTGSVNISPGIV
jgi:hypothetical protein